MSAQTQAIFYDTPGRPFFYNDHFYNNNNNRLYSQTRQQINK